MDDKTQPPPYPYQAPYPQQPYAPGPVIQGYPPQPQNINPYPPQSAPGPGYGGYPPQTAPGPGYTPQAAPGYGYPPQPAPPQQTSFTNQTQSPVFGGGFKQDDEAAPDGFGFPGQGFEDKAVRRGFIKRVYSILMVQLVITAVIISVFLFVDSVKGFVQQNRWFMWTSWGVALACVIVLACCQSVRRTFPHNFVVLGVFTLCEGCMLGTITSFYEVDAVLIAVGITAGVTLGLTLFAFQTKIDFTGCGAALFAMLIILIIASIILAFLPASKYKMIGLGAAGAVVFSLYLVYDTQLMMGGKHKYSLSPEEYIFAALNIYLDVINLFMYILMIVGGSRSD